MLRHMATAVLKVYARQALVDAHLRADESALLLEGCWPHGDSPLRRSLDEAIDARQAWIDDEASRLAHELASADIEGGNRDDRDERRTSNVQRPTLNGGVSAPFLLNVGRWTLDVGRSNQRGPAYLNELKLRYYLVKLLRVVAFFKVGQTFLSARQAGKPAPPAHGGIELVVARHRDEDYADLFESIAGAHRVPLVLTWRDGTQAPPPHVPPNRWWRRAAAALNSWTNPSWRDQGAPRVVLCGSRRVLGGICDELVARGGQVAWLYDRFAVQTWLRWRWAGVTQLVCNVRDRTSNIEPFDVRCSMFDVRCSQQLIPRLSCRGIDLSAPLIRWLANVQRQQGEQQGRLWQSIEAHFARLRPTTLVLDEDATPMARAAIAAARRHGAPSVVVQHGVPRVKFGFAPLAADHIFAWGASSRQQLLRWGVPLERIHVVGRTDCRSVRPRLCLAEDSPMGRARPTHSKFVRRTSNVQRRTSNIERRRVLRPARAPRPEILLFATTPPRDDRPDAVTFHFTSDAHRQMLRMACAAVASIPRARLTIKLHPRCRDAAPFRAVAAEFPDLRCRIMRQGDVARQAACVINCTSSAGIEAGALGAPVIELIPAGSLDLLPAREWNALGTARTEPELRGLLHVALNDGAAQRGVGAGDRGQVFAAVGREAARRAVDELLTIAPAATDCEAATTESSSSSSSSSDERRALRGRRRGRLQSAVSAASTPPP
jgi:hypothetical protein